MQSDPNLINKPKPSVLDKPIPKPKGEINLSTFAFLLSEMISYSNKRCSDIFDFKSKLRSFGRFVGVRLLELTYYREKKDKRETKFLDQLSFIRKNVWKSIYGKEADGLEKHPNDPLLYYIFEKDPIINKFLPIDRIESSGANFNAGIIEAILNESNFPCQVDFVLEESTVCYAITFDKSVIMREKPLDLK